MSASEPSADTFLRDVAEHRLTVLRDDGVDRHLRMRRPGTLCMGFDIITWAGHLCYTGDMGTYVFRRLEDMFEFFRQPGPEPMRPNRSYWAEKVQAADRDGIKVYSADIFLSSVKEWMDECEFSDDARSAVAERVLPYAHDGEHAARSAAYEFKEGDFDFVDFQERDLTEYSYRFVWCCYALPWAIREYDAARAK